MISGDPIRFAIEASASSFEHVQGTVVAYGDARLWIGGEALGRGSDQINGFVERLRGFIGENPRAPATLIGSDAKSVAKEVIQAVYGLDELVPQSKRWARSDQMAQFIIAPNGSTTFDGVFIIALQGEQMDRLIAVRPPPDADCMEDAFYGRTTERALDPGTIRRVLCDFVGRFDRFGAS